MLRRPRPNNRLTLEMRILGFGERGGPWYVTEYVLHDEDAGEVNLGRLDWADWDHRGDLLFARDGTLFRQPVRQAALRDPPKVVADLNALTFRARAPSAR